MKKHVDSSSIGECYPPKIRLDISSLHTHSGPQPPLMHDMPIRGISNITNFLLRANYNHIQPDTANQKNMDCNPCNHGELLRQLSTCAHKWKEIGSYLGFLPGELDKIQAAPINIPEAPMSWLSNMLAEWLEWAPGDVRGCATLNSLKVALRAAGFGKTAKKLTLPASRLP